MKIDIHNHFYPGSYLKELRKEGPNIGLEVIEDEWGRTVLVQRGTPVVTITDPMTDIDIRLEDMAKAGVDRQVLSLTVPNVEPFPAQAAASLARAANEDMSAICGRHPDRFMALGTLPYLDTDLALAELDHCLNKLGFKGVCIGSNLNGTQLDDPILYPVYQRLAEERLAVHIHPRAPLDKTSYRDYRMGPMLGFEIDLCIAVVRLIMGGILGKFPGLKFIVSHLGGAVPYLAARIENCYQAYPECRAKIDRPAAEYLNLFYWDTVSFHEPALMCAYHSFGAERMILGSDYPHVIGDARRAVTSIEELSIPEADKKRIFSQNLLTLLG